jgi:hypothetical protein
MGNVLQEEMVRSKADNLLSDLVEDLIDNSHLWDRGLTRADIIRIVKEQANELTDDEEEEL